MILESLLILMALQSLDFRVDEMPLENEEPRIVRERHVPVKALASSEEIVLIAQVVHAEAEGESNFGKMLVAKTILNRAEKGGWFGSTIREVVYKKGQFQGIKRKCFKQGFYDESDVSAVLLALAEEDYGQVLFFFDPKTSTDKKFVDSKLNSVVVVEGNHAFTE